MRFFTFAALVSLAAVFLASHTPGRAEMFPWEKQSAPVQQPASSQASKENAVEKLVLPKSFHMAGIPRVARGARGDLILTDREMVFRQGSKDRLVLPYERMRYVQMLSGARNYEGTTYGMAVAFGFPGALMILKKHKVDILIVDYLNERGGRMGLVMQVELRHGSTCKDWLTRFGVTVEEPAESSVTQPTKN